MVKFVSASICNALINVRGFEIALFFCWLGLYALGLRPLVDPLLISRVTHECLLSIDVMIYKGVSKQS
jgi:hypothetical protein